MRNHSIDQINMRLWLAKMVAICKEDIYNGVRSMRLRDALTLDKVAIKRFLKENYIGRFHTIRHCGQVSAYTKDNLERSEKDVCPLNSDGQAKARGYYPRCRSLYS
ncbi:MAG: hypothetical protein LBL58_14960 [Tannerellaceae bacterium]|jgi:hypothetical protein|nr:hypothetical protein [Tannerellaceae bacterium]